MAHEQTNPAILMREGTEPGYRWRQYLVISDERVAIVHMVPALFGWNIPRGPANRRHGRQKGTSCRSFPCG